MTINDRDFRCLVDFVRGEFGINLEHKRQLIEARLSFYLTRRGYRSFTPYVAEVITHSDGEECQSMMNRLSTNYTYFFRETDYVAELTGTVLPAFAAKGGKCLRVWSAACSSGQEAYSVAMVLSHAARFGAFSFEFEIVGTDINTEMLQVAAAGVYSAEEVSRIPECYHSYLRHRGDGASEIAPELRDKISWQYGNLLQTAPQPADFDVILCRNVMIYFTPQLRREMVARLQSALRAGGYLFTGVTESIDLERRYFRYLSPAFYQKAK